MARARLLKHGFFKNEDLASLPFQTRLCFAGLWLIADRKGRLEDRPRRIKIEIFPYDNVHVDDMLWQLAEHGFIERYTVEGANYISIPAFPTHQSPHIKEPESTIPAPDKHGASTRQAPGLHQSSPTSLKKEEKKVIQRKEERNLDPETETVTRSGDGSLDPETVAVTQSTNGNGSSRLNGRSKHPVFQGQRFVVFDWMLEDMGRILGSHADAFDLHAWFFDIDRRAVHDGLVIPKKDWWKWLQQQLDTEIARRRLPVASIQKQTSLQKAVANIRAGARA